MLIIKDADFSAVALDVVEPITPTDIKISVFASPKNGGSVTGGGYYEPGTEVEISATPNTGWAFIEWDDGDTNAIRTITVGDVDKTYTATFEPGYQPQPLTPLQQVSQMYVNLNDNGKVTYNSQQYGHIYAVNAGQHIYMKGYVLNNNIPTPNFLRYGIFTTIPTIGSVPVQFGGNQVAYAEYRDDYGSWDFVATETGYLMATELVQDTSTTDWHIEVSV